MKKPFRQRSKKLSVSGEWHVDCSCDIVKKNDNERLIPVKKLFLLLFVVVPMLFAYPLTADAMKMSKPVYLGEICRDQAGKGFHIEGATSNKGTKSTKYWYINGYEKGVATFGKGDLTVCVHYIYADGAERIGDKALSNTIESPMCCHRINAIKTDAGIIFYVITGVEDGEGFVILGKRPDGRFVKYIDSYKLEELYHWWDDISGRVFYGSVIRTEKDVIIVEYSVYGDTSAEGELRFTWDEKAQWFGVEKR